MLYIEVHIRFEVTSWIYLGDLNVMSINVLSNDLVQLLVQREMARGIKGVPKQGELVH
jgi:hypothetical protein